jgi:hypothetical protein
MPTNIITTGQTFNATDPVTSTKLQNIASEATFDDPVDETSLELITSGTNIGKLQIKDAGVTKAKIENVANLRVLGNTSGSAVAPQEVEILDDDTMDTADATTLATSESIKAYVDEYALKYSGATGNDLQVSGFSTYRDLDLSSVVGSNRALVIMELEGVGSASGADIFFRTKGSTVKPVGFATNPGFGASGGFVNGSNDGFTCVVITNASGVLEYTGTNATGISYVVQAYQKLR